jgi:drug/metabolite transporter (DMT)-like permease
MALPANKPASSLMVVIAFGIVYLVWGSTYYFIMLAIAHIPALLMAFMRFFTAGCLLMGYCALKGERIFVWKDMKPAIVRPRPPSRYPIQRSWLLTSPRCRRTSGGISG